MHTCVCAYSKFTMPADRSEKEAAKIRYGEKMSYLSSGGAWKKSLRLRCYRRINKIEGQC